MIENREESPDFSRGECQSAVTKYAEALGFHKPNSPRLEDHFGPHCFRHYFTTFLFMNGMPREYVKEHRGDSRREAIDIYNHIDREELRESYLACVPKLGYRIGLHRLADPVLELR